MLKAVGQFHRVRASDGRTLNPTSSDSAANVGVMHRGRGRPGPRNCATPPVSFSNQIGVARVVVGWRSRSINSDKEFVSREVLSDVVGWSSSGRLHRAWRCCLFGESWADRLQREGGVVHGKLKVPRGYVTSMVEAFVVAEGRARG